jgi:hypothetical protein
MCEERPLGQGRLYPEVRSGTSQATWPETQLMQRLLPSKQLRGCLQSPGVYGASASAGAAAVGVEAGGDVLPLLLPLPPLNTCHGALGQQPVDVLCLCGRMRIYIDTERTSHAGYGEGQSSAPQQEEQS